MLYKVRRELPNLKLLISLMKLSISYSLLRSFQYHFLENFEFAGDLLDFGGGNAVDYRNRIRSNGYFSINIDPSIAPTWVINPNTQFHSDIGKFNFIMSLNTLEHIYDPKNSLRELSNVLLDDGVIVISTPFIFKIHAHPNDYCRLTPDWYRETLMNLGYKKCIISLIYWGPLSTAASVSFKYGPNKYIKILCLIIDYVYFKFKSLFRRGITLPDCPIGLWVLAFK